MKLNSMSARQGARRGVGAPLCVLTVAGSDSGGGAGILADARVIRAGGAHPVAAITAVTAQNLHGVQRWERVPAELIAAQIEAVWEDFAIGAVKTGLLPGADAVRAVAKVLSRLRGQTPVVVDPVLSSTSGTRFLDHAGIEVLKRVLLPLAVLVTPNWPEAEALTGLPVRNESQAAEAARRLVAEGCQAVLIKGGHGSERRVVDLLVTAGGRERAFAAKRIASRNTHGTGCVLSAGIALHLAKGAALAKAVAKARHGLLLSLKANRRLRWSGIGPV